MRLRHPSRRRPGTVYVLFALIVWVLMGLAALTIDLGLVKATQRTMQSMTDEAAMEALYNLNQTADQRQQAAQLALTTAMTDTQDTPNDTQRFGAGPLINFSGGTLVSEGFTASQTLSINNPKVYQPTLAVNTSNAVDGDIVQGTYTTPTTLTPLILEGDDYTRQDFSPATQGTAILVRLRRSNESFPAGDPSRSNGPAMPFLFARGSVRGKQLDPGVTVRATSIAAARPVLIAGPTLQAQNLPGVAPIGLQLASWQTWRQQNQSATTLTASVDGTGTISGNVTGAFAARATGVTVIGQPFTASGSTTALLGLDSYVPLYDTISGQNRVVGFLNCPGLMLSPDAMTLTLPLSSAVATGNATASFSPGSATNPLAGMSAADLNSLFTFTTNAVSTGSTDPLSAPALVR